MNTTTAPWSRLPTGMLVGAAVLGIVLTLPGCSNVRTEGDPDFAVRPGTTYAWATPERADQLDDGGESLPWSEIRRSITSELRDRDLVEAPAHQADLLLEDDLQIVRKIQNNHPYYDVYIAEKYEEAILRISFRDAVSQELKWSGESHERLRYIERSMGGVTTLRWTPTDEARDWQVPQLVSHILNRLPVREPARIGDDRQP